MGWRSFIVAIDDEKQLEAISKNHKIVANILTNLGLYGQCEQEFAEVSNIFELHKRGVIEYKGKLIDCDYELTPHGFKVWAGKIWLLVSTDNAITMEVIMEHYVKSYYSSSPYVPIENYDKAPIISVESKNDKWADHIVKFKELAKDFKPIDYTQFDDVETFVLFTRLDVDTKKALKIDT